MGEIHKLRVKSPYELMKLEDIKIENKPNKHGYLYLKGLIEDNINFDAAIKASTKDEISVYEEMGTASDDETLNINQVDERNSRRLFSGIVQNIKTTNENGIYYIEIQALTSSSKLDIKEKGRSFQNVNMTYDDLIKEIIKDYSGFTFIQNAGSGQKINKPLFQYKETDWNFLKRIASELNSELYCDIINSNYLFNFGIAYNKNYEINDNLEYSAFKDIRSFYKAGGKNAGYADTDFFYYEVEKKDVFEINAEIKYKQKNLYVREYEAYRKNEEIFYKYKLCVKKGKWQGEIKNKELKGVTLEGKVIAVQKEQVKLHLNIDEKQEESTAYWFNYRPPSVNIMYSMPLVGESVKLYFPNENSEIPIVTGCIRKNGETCAQTADPANRYLQTEHGNEIAMLPEALSIKAGKRKTLSITFNDKTGVHLKSHKGLKLNADEEIIIKTRKRVKIKAHSQLVLIKRNKSHGISIEGDINIKGNNVIMNGSSRDTYIHYAEADNKNVFIKENNVIMNENIRYRINPFIETENENVLCESKSIIINEKNLNSYNSFDTESDNEGKWTDVDGSYYYYFANGNMATSWTLIKGNWYYLYPGGSMAWGETIHGSSEDDENNEFILKYDNQDGKMITGNGWLKDSGSGAWYYFTDGEAAKGWKKINDAWYYFHPAGSMAASKVVEEYYVDANGRWVENIGWQEDDKGKWYYVGSGGKVVTGWKEIKNKWYYFDDNGEMKTGWIKDNNNGNWYYLHSDGDMATGWIEDKGDWYFLKPEGDMASDTIIDEYLLDKSGKMETGTGWKDIGGSSYYFKGGNKVATGWLKYGNSWYFFYKGGSMAHNLWIDGSYIDDNGEWIPNMDSYVTDKNNSQNTNNTYEEPRWNDKVVSYLKGTQRFQWFKEETQEGELKSFFDIGGFDRDENGVYHAKQDAIAQSRAGYNDLYDDVFNLACSMSKGKYEFETSSEEYIVWLWKGDYLNLGAGAEIGIYKGGEPWWACDIEDAMPMTLRVEDKEGNLIFDWKPTERNWWCTGFNPEYQDMQEQNLTVYGSIDFSKHLDMWDAFYDRWNGRSLWNFDQKPIAKFIWK